MMGIENRLEYLKTKIDCVSVADAQSRLESGATLVDVRESSEREQGSPAGSIHISRGLLEVRVAQLVPNVTTPLLVICASGVRSLLAANTLVEMGYQNVKSVEGGFAAWRALGLPMVGVAGGEIFSSSELSRYARHFSLREIGREGQVRLKRSHVVIVGAGGLGCPAATYLAAVGIGKITLIDHDVVEMSNLQRQTLHSEMRLGISKVESARIAIAAINPHVNVISVNEKFSKSNASALLEKADVVIDACDNIPTRYLIDTVCCEKGIPNIHGAIYRFEGQISVFGGSGQKDQVAGPCYRCLFPSPPPTDLAPNCAETGVVGVLPGIIGSIQAMEAIKLLLDMGKSLRGRLLTYDALECKFREIKLIKNQNCPVCSACYA